MSSSASPNDLPVAPEALSSVVAQASPPASSGGVSPLVLSPRTETVREPAGGAACATTNTCAPELPPLHTSTLDCAQVEQLLTDIETCTELLGILPKYAAQGHVPEAAGVTLGQARELLATRAVRGLQLRYRYDGAEWWDTLLSQGEFYRIVRIRHAL